MAVSNEQIVKIMGVLHAAFPLYAMQKQTIQIYCDALQDLELEYLEEAARIHIATEKFFPTIAELRAASVRIREYAANVPLAAEAWGEVVEKMRTIGSTVDFGGGQPKFSNPLIDRVVRYLDWNLLCLTDNITADRARFIQAYEVELARERENMRFLPSTHDAIARLRAENVHAGVKQLAEKLSGKTE